MTIRGGRGGGRRLMEETILNFHFDYLTPRLSSLWGSATSISDGTFSLRMS